MDLSSDLLFLGHYIILTQWWIEGW